MKLLMLLALMSCSAVPVRVADKHAPQASFPVGQTIYFEGEVNWDSVAAFQAKLYRIEGPVTVVINTFGGGVFAGQRMAQAIERHGEVTCRVEGSAMSMGLYVLQSCEHREMTAWSLLLGHEASGGAEGQPDEIYRSAEFLRKLSHALAAYIVRNSNMTVEQYEAAVAHGGELLLTADEALRFGFIDSIRY